jgi:hypothetical protein
MSDYQVNLKSKKMTMKRKPGIFRNLLLVLITGVVFYSCNKDDEKTDPIVGTWTTGTSTFSVTVDSKSLTQYFIDLGFSAEDAQTYADLFDEALKQAFTGTITVKSDHTYSSNLDSSPDSGTWSLNSDRSELTITSSTEGPMTFDVIELTSSKMHLHALETTNEDLNGDETLEVLSVEVDLNLTK